jgi:hypothetical protein
MTYILKINLTRCYKSLCCPIMCVYVQSSVLWCPLRFPHETIFCQNQLLMLYSLMGPIFKKKDVLVFYTISHQKPLDQWQLHLCRNDVCEFLFLKKQLLFHLDSSKKHDRHLQLLVLSCRSFIYLLLWNCQINSLVGTINICEFHHRYSSLGIGPMKSMM